MDDDKKALLNLAAGDSRAIRIGDSVLYPPMMVGAKAFQFDPWQNGFLYWLQELKGDMELACRKVGKSLEWGQRFISTRKFREFRNSKITNLAVNNGALLEEWREIGISGMRGYRDWYEGKCDLCHEDNQFSTTDIEVFRNDDMALLVSCKVCFQPITTEYKKEEFHPTREQVQFWSEIGNRVSPKIERVQHEFSNENFVFAEKES